MLQFTNPNFFSTVLSDSVPNHPPMRENAVQHIEFNDFFTYMAVQPGKHLWKTRWNRRVYLLQHVISSKLLPLKSKSAQSSNSVMKTTLPMTVIYLTPYAILTIDGQIIRVVYQYLSTSATRVSTPHVAGALRDRQRIAVRAIPAVMADTATLRCIRRHRGIFAVMVYVAAPPVLTHTMPQT